METKYEDALKFMKEHNLLPQFRGRAKKCVDATEGVGWGYHDILAQYFYEFYDE